MDRKAKSILKIAVPVAIMVQLTAIIFLLARMNKDKAFYCRTYAKGAIDCRQIKIQLQNCHTISRQKEIICYYRFETKKFNG